MFLLVHLSLLALCLASPLEGTAANVTSLPGDAATNGTWLLEGEQTGKDGATANASVASTEPEVTEAPPLWCPEDNELVRTAGTWTHVCRPKLCDSTEIHPIQCPIKYGSSFWKCDSRFGSWPASQYRMLANGSLQILSGGAIVPLGEFWIHGQKAVACDPTGAGMPEDRPQWCSPFRDFGNGSYGHLLDGRVPQNLIRKNGSTVDFCVPMDPSMQTCKKYPLNANEIRLLPDLSLYTNLSVEVVYQLGHYVLATDHSFAVICIETGFILTKETSYLYGAVAILSAVALLLALVAHIFFPSLNYHTKALLCLAFSLLVMYIALAVRLLFSPFQDSGSNLCIFAFQYTFALAAFFWLSVISFDLWRVFSKLRGTTMTGNNAARKRVFLAKCIYAFGIPLVMCIIVMSLASSKKAQDRLGLVLPLQTTNWFYQTRALFLFFYGPILAILVENVVFFILTVVNIRKASCGTSMVNKKMSRKLLRVYMKLFLVMGITWFAEVISWLCQSQTDQKSWYFTDLINCLQGFFIFMIYVCKRRTLIIIKNKMGYITDSQAQATSSTMDSERKVSSVALPKMRRESKDNLMV